MKTGTELFFILVFYSIWKHTAAEQCFKDCSAFALIHSWKYDKKFVPIVSNRDIIFCPFNF